MVDTTSAFMAMVAARSSNIASPIRRCCRGRRRVRTLPGICNPAMPIRRNSAGALRRRPLCAQAFFLGRPTIRRVTTHGCPILDRLPGVYRRPGCGSIRILSGIIRLVTASSFIPRNISTPRSTIPSKCDAVTQGMRAPEGLIVVGRYARNCQIPLRRPLNTRRLTG